MLGQAFVLLRRRAPEVVEAQPETLCDIGLHGIHLGAVVLHRLACLGGGQLGRRAVLISGAEKQHLLSPAAQIAGVEVRRQLAAHQIAEVLDAVDVGDRGGDEVTGHGEVPWAIPLP